MTPSSTGCNRKNSLRTYAKAFGNLPTCSAARRRFADVPHIILGQLGSVMFSTMRHPLLRRSILHILGVRSEEQVVGVDAVSNIAFMADKKTFGNRPNDQLIRKSMCPRFMRPPTVILAHKPVPIAIRHPLPEPTIGGLLDLRPKLGSIVYNFHVNPFTRGFGRTGGASNTARTSYA
jgi:hypothetical protein